MVRYGYARVSSEDQDLSLQRSALLKADVDDIRVEKQSGARDDRPELAMLLDSLASSDELYVWKLDRLGRNFQHLYTTVMDLRDRGVKFVSLRESIDTGSPVGRIFFILLAAFAEFERELIRERTLAGLVEARARGFVPGERLYGFEAFGNGQIDHEAEVIREAADRVLGGTKLLTIVNDFNERDITTARGSRWAVTTLRRILVHDRTAAIVGHDKHTELLAILKAPERQRQGRPAHHLLGGFLFGRCGVPMYVQHGNTGTRIYRCKKTPVNPGACGKCRINAEVAEVVVQEKALSRWSIVREVHDDANVQDATSEVMGLESQLADLAERVRRNEVSLEFALPLEAGWRADLEAARGRRDAGLAARVRVPHPQARVQELDAQAAWRSFSVEERRDVLRTLQLRAELGAENRIIVRFWGQVS
jgi:DNA invertase Pin-like site-specific DNA recombinase